MTWANAALLRAAANRARGRAGFLGYDLAAYQELTGHDPLQRLGIDERRLARLALCRTPRHGPRFGHDVLAISAQVEVDPVSLAGLLRLTGVFAELQDLGRSADERADHPPAAVLAAARDEGEEHTVLTDVAGAAVGLPGWLHEAVERFWAQVPTGGRFPRDLDFAVLVGLPLAVVELPRLSLKTISEWLGSHRLALGIAGRRDRRLRACLVALGGVGLIFVDAGDDATQRRVSLAHEAAHFIIEYLLPRKEVAHRRPELLEVVDGRRPATSRERLSAVLGDVPIGVHTHMLDRTPAGHAATDRVDEAEWRARRVALELLAPQAVILERMRHTGLRDQAEVRTLLVDEFGLPMSLADDYAEQLLRLAAPPRPGLLDLLSRQQPSEGRKGMPSPPGETGEEASETGRSSAPMPEED
ncbi:MAG: hypothetical protein ACRDT4_14015 [Micromonosporaceae bacterium]